MRPWLPYPLSRSRYGSDRSFCRATAARFSDRPPKSVTLYFSKLFHSLPISGNSFRDRAWVITLGDCKHTARCHSAFGGDNCGNYGSNVLIEGSQNRHGRLPNYTAAESRAERQHAEVTALVLGPSSSPLIASAKVSARKGL